MKPNAHKMAAELIILDWHRVKMLLISLSGIYLLFAVLVASHPLFSELLAVIYFVSPVLTGLVLGAGLVADDEQDGIRTLVLSLPVSRSFILWVRMIFRVSMVLLFLAFWQAVPVILGLRTFPETLASIHRNSSGIYPEILMLATGLIFISGVFFSVLMKTSFESAIWAGCFGLSLMAAISNSTGNRMSLNTVYILWITGTLLAARNLFLSRHPLNWQGLRNRTFLWGLAIAGLTAAIIRISG